jgi:1,4-alpha-glucan branching enzyme
VYDVFANIINGRIYVSALDDSLKNESYKFPKGSLHVRATVSHEKNIENTQTVEKFTQQGTKAMAVLAFTIPGVPIIYNGEEVGNSRYLNLFDKVDIDWSNGQDFRELYEQLGVLRHNHPALQHGFYTFLQNTKSTKVYSFFRSSGMDSVLTVINFAEKKNDVDLQMPAGSSIVWKDIFSGVSFHKKDSCLNVGLLPLGYMVLVPETERIVQ